MKKKRKAKRRLGMVLILVAVMSSVAPSALHARTWTDSTGKYKIEGEFVKLADGTVDIRRDDGKLIRIPLEKLSEADQKYVQQASKPTAEETPFAVAADEERPMVKVEAGGDSSDTQTVLAEGVGVTKEEALKDAFRAAVRQVVGEVVDGETLVKNDELVKDQVLTYSDGFIPKHEVLSTKQESGVFRITIRAHVQRRSVIMKLKAANITVKAVDGQSMFGNIVTQLGAEKDAAALVAKALEGFPDNYMEARVVGEPKTMGKSDSGASLVVNVEFAPSPAAYRTFAERFCQTLEGIGKVKGEFTSVVQECADGMGFTSFCVDNRSGYFSNVAAKWMPELWSVRSSERKWAADSFGLAVATLASKDSSRMDWKYYILDESVGDTVVRAFTRNAECKLSLLDAEGQLVSVDRFNARAKHRFDLEKPENWTIRMEGLLMTPPLIDSEDNKGYAQDYSWRRYGKWKPRLALVAPAFILRCTTTELAYVPKVTILRTVKLSLDEVKRVAKVKCELTFRAGNDAGNDADEE